MNTSVNPSLTEQDCCQWCASVMLSFLPHHISLVSPLQLSKASLKTDHFWDHGSPLHIFFHYTSLASKFFVDYILYFGSIKTQRSGTFANAGVQIDLNTPVLEQLQSHENESGYILRAVCNHKLCWSYFSSSIQRTDCNGSFLGQINMFCSLGLGSGVLKATV